jgi:hypothetical protein
MIRVAVSPRAYRVSKSTLLEGMVSLKPERDEQGRYLLRLDEATANSLSVQRRIGDNMSDVIMRLSVKGQALISIRTSDQPAESHYGLFGIFDFRAE